MAIMHVVAETEHKNENQSNEDDEDDNDSNNERRRAWQTNLSDFIHVVCVVRP